MRLMFLRNAAIIFMDTFERAQVISYIGPHSFSGICMNFSKPIAIIVTRPFMFRMKNGGMIPNDVVICLPFIGIACGIY